MRNRETSFGGYFGERVLRATILTFSVVLAPWRSLRSSRAWQEQQSLPQPTNDSGPGSLKEAVGLPASFLLVGQRKLMGGSTTREKASGEGCEVILVCVKQRKSVRSLEMKGKSRLKWATTICALAIFAGILGGLTQSEAAAQATGNSPGGVNATAGSASSQGGVITGGSRANQDPVAKNNSYRIREDSILRVSSRGVLENDRDPDRDKLSARKVSKPRHGKLTLRSNGSFVYKPNKNYSGRDSFVYKAQDGKGGSDRAIVRIRIRGVNDRPVAGNNRYTTLENRRLVVRAPGILRNDKDVDGNRLKAAKVSGPRHGKLKLKRNGSFVYTPSNNYSGRDFFIYKARDGRGGSNRAIVRIRVKAKSSPPDNPPPDDAPTVVNTTPSDGATAVPVSSDITVEFSEGVNVSASSFELKCPSTGSERTFSLSGGGTSYTLDPTDDLPAGTKCQVRVIAGEVSDTDKNDPPDNMASGFIFTFTTVPEPAMSLTFSPTSSVFFCQPTLQMANFEPNTTYTVTYEGRVSPAQTTPDVFAPVIVTTDDSGDANRDVASFRKGEQIRLSTDGVTTGWTDVSC